MSRTLRWFLPVVVLTTALGCSQGEQAAADQHGPADAGEVASPAHAGEAAGGDRPLELALPPALQTVLQQEMQQIESGMHALLSHLASGRAPEAAAVARKIHDSFILEQALAPDELESLEKLLPAPFLELDEAFHGSAAALVAAAERRDVAAGMTIYGELAQACVRCHAKYARTRFPDFATP